MPWAIPAAIVGGAIIGGVSNYLGGKSQADAATQGTMAQVAEAQAAREQAARLGEQGANLIGTAATRGQARIWEFGQQSMDALRTGQADSLSAMASGYNGANTALTRANTMAGQYLRGQAVAGRNDLLGGIGAGQSSLAGAQYGLASGAPTMQGVFGGFQQDPGYQFRQQQGEQAIERQAAAAGGRASPRTMEALANFNSGLASQQYNDFAQQRLQLSGQQQQNLGMQSQLAQARAANALQGAGLLESQGQQSAANLSNLATSYGSQMAGLSSGYGTQLANIYGNNATQIANLNSQVGANWANLGLQGAQGRANALNNVASQNTAITQSLLPAYQAATPYAGAGWQAAGNTIANVGNNLAFLYAMNQGGGYGGSMANAYGYGSVPTGTGAWSGGMQNLNGF